VEERSWTQGSISLQVLKTRRNTPHVCSANGTASVLKASRMQKHMQKCKACPSIVKETHQSSHCEKVLPHKRTVVVSPSSEPVCSVDMDKGEEDTDLVSAVASTSNMSDLNTGPVKKEKVAMDSILTNFADRMTLDKQQKAELLLARAIYSSGTPLSIVENNHWQVFFRNPRPSFQLPSRYIGCLDVCLIQNVTQ